MSKSNSAYDNNAIIFYDDNGMPVISIIGDAGLDGEQLADIFDTPRIRREIQDACGLAIDNVSEDYIELE